MNYIELINNERGTMSQYSPYVDMQTSCFASVNAQIYIHYISSIFSAAHLIDDEIIISFLLFNKIKSISSIWIIQLFPTFSFILCIAAVD